MISKVLLEKLRGPWTLRITMNERRLIANTLIRQQKRIDDLEAFLDAVNADDWHTANNLRKGL